MRDPLPLRDALENLAVIRQQMAAMEVFRGYRAAPVACSALLAIVAGFLQPVLLPQPTKQIEAYVVWWSMVALLSMGVAAFTMFLRDRVAGASYTRRITWLAVTQFAPCLLSGAALTFVVVRWTPEVVWLLPGLWQILFSQGVWAACRLLPRFVCFVPLFYLLTGLGTFVFARGDQALAPWAMAIPFGVGQWLAATLLYWTLERYDGQTQEDTNS